MKNIFPCDGASYKQAWSKSRRLRPLKQALIYVLFGICWILVTDWIVASMALPFTEHTIQSSKGLVFVLMTTLLVYWLARRAVLQSEHEALQETLQATERVFRSTLNTLGEAVVLEDPSSGNIIEFNPAAENIFGYDHAEVIGKSMELLHVDRQSYEHFVALSQPELTQHAVFRGDYRMKRRDGAIIETTQCVSKIQGGGGERGGVLSIVRDITEQRAAQRHQKVLLERIACLYRIDQAILSQSALKIVLRQVAQETRAALAVDAASILVKKEPQHRLETGASVGFANTVSEDACLRLDEGVVGCALMQRKPITIPDIQSEEIEFARREMARAEGFHGYACCPIIIKGHFEGVLEVFKREAVAPDSSELEFLQSLAAQTAIAIDNVTAFTQLQTSNEKLLLAYDSSIEGWSRALDCRDKETEGHSQRVTEITVELARRAGVEESHLKYVRWGSLLHDIGKMGVPDSILLKPGKLTDDEWQIIRHHPEIARDLLRPIKHLAQAIDIPYCHHEKWDGSGYPRGLKGEDIPQAARIFAVVDIWDALRSDRPYRKGWSKEAVLAHLKQIAGSHLDPEYVDIFCDAVDEIPACSSPHYANRHPNNKPEV